MEMMPPLPAASLNLWEDSTFRIVLLFVKDGMSSKFSPAQRLHYVTTSIQIRNAPAAG